MSVFDLDDHFGGLLESFVAWQWHAALDAALVRGTRRVVGGATRQSTRKAYFESIWVSYPHFHIIVTT